MNDSLVPAALLLVMVLLHACGPSPAGSPGAASDGGDAPSDTAADQADVRRADSGGAGGSPGSDGGGMKDGGGCPAEQPRVTFSDGGLVFQRCSVANQVCTYLRAFCECKRLPGVTGSDDLVWDCPPILLRSAP